MNYIIINDNAAGFAVNTVEPVLEENTRVLVIIDQIIPANSPDVSDGQRQLMGWAAKHDFPYCYGRVMTSAFILGDESGDLEYKVQAGDTVVATTDDVFVAEKIEAKAIKVNEKGLMDCLKGISPQYDGSSLKANKNVFLSSDRIVNCVYIGGQGGSLEDIKAVAAGLKNKHIAYGLRLIVSPNSANTYIAACDGGYFTTIMEAGGLVLNQCASPVVQGRIGGGELMVSNDIYDQVGYNGPEDSSIILVSTEEAVKIALTGRLGEVE